MWDSRRLPPMSRITSYRSLPVSEVFAGVVDDVVGADGAGPGPSSEVLHTPVTSAQKALAIWTAKVPTPPEAANEPAPSVRGSTRAWSRTACGAVSAETEDGRRLLEREARRLGCESSLARRGPTGEGAVAGAVDLIARLEPGHLLADPPQTVPGQAAAQVGEPWACGARRPPRRIEIRQACHPCHVPRSTLAAHPPGRGSRRLAVSGLAISASRSTSSGAVPYSSWTIAFIVPVPAV